MSTPSWRTGACPSGESDVHSVDVPGSGTGSRPERRGSGGRRSSLWLTISTIARLRYDATRTGVDLESQEQWAQPRV